MTITTTPTDKLVSYRNVRANIFLGRTYLRLSVFVIAMSGLETVKIIVDAEKEASKMLNDARLKALEIRKQVDAMIIAEREKRLSSARKEAESLVRKAEAEGKAEGARVKEDSIAKTERDLHKASSARAAAEKALFEIIMG
jgi:vacuolar-type H+-ATPase subunit H